MARIKRASLLLALYTAIPFFASTYLAFSGAPAVWEVSGFIPLAILASFALRSEKSSSPLFTRLLTPLFGIFFSLAFLFPALHFLKNREPVAALQLLVSIYSPAVVLSAVAVFLRFIVETATINIVLNNFRLFIHGARIDRILFDSPAFLLLGQVNLSGIITAEGVSREAFLKKVNELNKEFSGDAANNDLMQRDAQFTRTMKDGSTLTIGTLYLLIKKEHYRTDGLALPPDLTAKSFVAIAENRRILGYYVIDRFDASTNEKMLGAIAERYGVTGAVVGTDRFAALPLYASFDQAGPGHRDLWVTERPTADHPAITLGWGTADRDACDMYLAEPYLFNILKLFILLSTVTPRLHRSVALSSFPFVLPLFLSVFRLQVPQLNAVAVLLMILLTIVQSFKTIRAD
jgi:hypothetical protein